MEPSADTADPAPADHPGPEAAPATGTRRRRVLDRRTLGICVCVALVGAIVAALVASALLGDDDDGSGRAGSDPETTPMQIVETIDVEELMAVELRTPAGEATSLADFAALATDRPIVVNMWAQSCVPCIEEMPLLDEVSRANPDLAFLGVNNDLQAQFAKAEVMAERTGITYPWLHDASGDFSTAARVAGMPTTFILMPSGEVVGSKTGAFKSKADLQGWLDDHVA